MKSKVLQRKMFRDPSEDENVGIMQGFMDSLEEMLTGEGDMSEEEDDSPSGAPDRTPRSPEILMNTMRGDMRSVDARVEELADMVGYNAASSTPLEVLALLQPVLKQQGIAALPTSSAMPPSPAMAPPPSTSVPPVPTQGGGIATLPQGDMGQGPPPMDMPMQMADGGVVQNFAEGDEVNAENVTPADTGTFSPEMMALFNKRLLKLQQSADTVPSELAPGYLMQRTQELAPQYRTLIGADPSASKGQMLFDVAQAALNYAGNVNAQGQQMRGSQAARLAGAFSGLPAAIGARAADAQKQNQNIRLAAMQGAQGEIEAARAAGTSRQDTLDKIAIEAMKKAGSTPQPLTTADKVRFGITGADASLPWVFGPTGVPAVTGGRAPASPAVPLTPEETGMGIYIAKLAGELPGRTDGSAKIVGMQGNVTNLLTLSNTVGDGPINEIMTTLFPNSNSPGAAYKAVVSQMLPQMRPPGSGAQSDKDIDVLRAGFGQLSDTDETRRFVLLTLQQKIDLEKEKLNLISRYGLPVEQGGLGILELNRKLLEIDSRSIMSPGLLDALKTIVGADRVNNIYAGTETSVARSPAEITAAATAAQRGGN